MEGVQAVANVVARGALESAASSSPATSTAKPACASDNDYNGRINLRVSAIFVILVGSMLGICSSRHPARLPLAH